MKDASTVPSYVVGIDLGDRSSRACVLDTPTGDLLEESRVRTSRLGLEQRFAGVEPMRVALEVGPHSRWVSQCLAELGHEVIVANPRKVRLISQNRAKDDRVDARVLAQLAPRRLDNNWPSHGSAGRVDAGNGPRPSSGRNAPATSRLSLPSHRYGGSSPAVRSDR